MICFRNGQSGHIKKKIAQLWAINCYYSGTTLKVRGSPTGIVVVRVTGNVVKGIVNSLVGCGCILVQKDQVR